MQCKFYNCEEIANYPFPACGTTHGLMLKYALKDLKAFQNGELKVTDLYAGEGLDISINELEYYSKLI